MADAIDLEKRAQELREAEGRRKEATDAKAQADVELLNRVLRSIASVLPLICQQAPGGQKAGIELVPGKAETTLYADGELDEEPLWLVNHYSIRTMLETLAQAIEKQEQSRNKAADKAEKYAAKVRLILAMLKTEI